MILDKTFAVLKKDLLNAVRYRTGLVFNVIAPAAQLATFYYLARAVGPQFRPDGMPYLPFLLVGTGFYTFLLAGMHSFVRIIQEAQQTGTLEVLMTTSTRPSMLLLLSAISALAGALVQLVIYVGGGMLLFDSVPRVNLPGGVAVFVLSALSALAVGVLAAGLQVSVQKGSAALWLLGSGAWLLAGTLFPVGALPAPVQIVSSFL
ncbi:MAG TPA: ABC transporter permease, partial [Terriglobales bacterium]|nr:ABC transporter permease [Terriglobales bacterium]